MEIITWLIDKFIFRKVVRVLVHEAFFLEDPQKISHYFIKIINLSRNDSISITHVWICDNGKNRHIINEMKLPRKLEPSEVCEFYIRKDSIIDQDKLFFNVNVKLSDNSIYKSKKNIKVPPIGNVAN